jgi:hypothetical protein
MRHGQIIEKGWPPMPLPFPPPPQPPLYKRVANLTGDDGLHHGRVPVPRSTPVISASLTGEAALRAYEEAGCLWIREAVRPSWRFRQLLQGCE